MPGIFDREPGFADAAQTVNRLFGNDRSGLPTVLLQMLVKAQGCKPKVSHPCDWIPASLPE